MKPASPDLNSSPVRIVTSYAFYGALWIIFSDLLVMKLLPEPFHASVSIAKGSIFILFTSLLLYYLIGRQLTRMTQLATAQKRAIEAQEEASERMAVILDGIDALIYVADLKT
ncbi:MAG: hypothetical protein U1D97_08370, partial [Desulfuromonadales bacterium]|nr:hypothetical protein [Desulfuromonadales bacterium]